MKFVKGKMLWVIERRGATVFAMGGKSGRPGVPKSKIHRSEALAVEAVEVQTQKRIADGYQLVDADAGLDSPFTLDGAAKRSNVPPKRFQYLVDQVRVCVQTGFWSPEEIDDFVIDQLMAAGAPEFENLFGEVISKERFRLRNATPPSPCINELLSAAFLELEGNDVIACEGLVPSFFGSTPLQTLLNQRPSAEGACAYKRKEAEMVLAGHGLRIFCATPQAQELETFIKSVLEVLQKHGVPASWTGGIEEPIRVAPFDWFRPMK